MLLAAILAVALAGHAVALVGHATAGGSVDIAGRWKCCGSGGAAAHTMDITSGTGALHGKAILPSGTAFATISGTLSGHNVTIVETYNSFSPGYVSTMKGTVSSDVKTMSGTWSSNRGQSGTWSATLAAALPPPVLGKSVDAAPVSGTVLIERPGKRFVRLTAGARIPVGSTIDTTAGVVTLTAAFAKGKTTHGNFYSGLFKVTQRRTAAAETTLLTLEGPKPAGCAAPDATIARHRPHKRLLWASAGGNFTTQGSYGAAAERGTKWLTEDECAGTLIKVTQGSVVVDDFPHHRTFVLSAPHSFIAHPGKGG